MEIEITYFGSACILISINGYTILTDPILDRKSSCYFHHKSTFSKKRTVKELIIEKEIDLILLSNNLHKVNLDNKGIELINSHKNVISTVGASKKHKNITPLKEWQSIKVMTDSISNLEITAVPAYHRPTYLPEFLSGKVIGFIITCDELNGKHIYISGDTVINKEMFEIAEKFKVTIAITNIGRANSPYLFSFSKFTMSYRDLIYIENIFNPELIFPIHFEDWSHFENLEKTTHVNKKIIIPEKHFTYSLII